MRLSVCVFLPEVTLKRCTTCAGQLTADTWSLGLWIIVLFCGIRSKVSCHRVWNKEEKSCRCTLLCFGWPISTCCTNSLLQKSLTSEFPSQFKFLKWNCTMTQFEWIVQISFMRFVFYDFILDYSIGWKYEIHVASR